MNSQYTTVKYNTEEGPKTIALHYVRTRGRDGPDHLFTRIEIPRLMAGGDATIIARFSSWKCDRCGPNRAAYVRFDIHHIECICDDCYQKVRFYGGGAALFHSICETREVACLWKDKKSLGRLVQGLYDYQSRSLRLYSVPFADPYPDENSHCVVTGDVAASWGKIQLSLSPESLFILARYNLRLEAQKILNLRLEAQKSINLRLEAQKSLNLRLEAQKISNNKVKRTVRLANRKQTRTTGR